MPATNEQLIALVKAQAALIKAHEDRWRHIVHHHAGHGSVIARHVEDVAEAASACVAVLKANRELFEVLEK